jgi:hypothetical protein
MEFLVIISGRYHPYHKGHKAVYDYAAKMFGPDSVFIATSDSQAPVTSPFSYSDKVRMMTSLGIPASHIVQTKSPYQAKEITSQVTDPENTVVIYCVSEKDMEGEGARFKFGTKKDGSPSYLQPLPSDISECQPMTNHAYVMVVPTVTFKVLGHDANSATQLRKLYLDSDDNTREHIITDLYGEYDPALKDTFDTRLDITDKAQEITKISKDKKARGKLSDSQKTRLCNNLQHILLAEARVHRQDWPTKPPVRAGYISEK